MTDTATPETPPPAPRGISVRLGIGSAIFQGLLVVLGVVLGFFITEWQTDASRRAEAQHALAGIMDELAANHESVIAAQTYHDAKIKVLDTSAAEKSALDIRSFERGFVAPAQVSSAAWTSAGEIGALANLPFDQVLNLSRVYSQQAAYTQQQATVSSVIYGEMFQRGTFAILDHPAGLRAILTTFSYREKQLAESYSKALGLTKTE